MGSGKTTFKLDYFAVNYIISFLVLVSRKKLKCKLSIQIRRKGKVLMHVMLCDFMKHIGGREQEPVPPASLCFHKRFAACSPPICK